MNNIKNQFDIARVYEYALNNNTLIQKLYFHIVKELNKLKELQKKANKEEQEFQSDNKSYLNIVSLIRKQSTKVVITLTKMIIEEINREKE